MLHIYDLNDKGEVSLQGQISVAKEGDHFGFAISANHEDRIVEVAAYLDAREGVGIIQNKSPKYNKKISGTVYVFELSSDNSSWDEKLYAKVSNAQVDDLFWWSPALDKSSDTLALGAVREDSSGTGVNAPHDNNEASASGAVYIFRHSENSWTQAAYIKPPNTGKNDFFGYSVVGDVRYSINRLANRHGTS